MKLRFCSSIFSLFVLAGFSTSALAATVELQESFTSAQNGTLPTSLTADYDPGVDVAVVPLASMQPVPTVDHPGGDGSVRRGSPEHSGDVLDRRASEHGALGAGERHGGEVHVRVQHAEDRSGPGWL